MFGRHVASVICLFISVPLGVAYISSFSFAYAIVVFIHTCAFTSLNMIIASSKIVTFVIITSLNTILVFITGLFGILGYFPSSLGCYLIQLVLNMLIIFIFCIERKFDEVDAEADGEVVSVQQHVVQQPPKPLYISSYLKENPSKTHCPICLDHIIIETQKNLFLCAQCRTTFHIDCLQKWSDIKKNCPFCKSLQEIVQIEIIPGDYVRPQDSP
jgi:hypothetical protein